MLIAFCNSQRIEARKAGRGLDYTCPHCGSAMILKCGQIVTAHFAHKAALQCDWCSGETEVHLAAKERLVSEFRDRNLSAECEVEVPALAGDRRADVMVWSPAGQPVAIELQHSTIGLRELERRAFAYAGAGLAQMWIPFLEPDVFRTATRRDGGPQGDRFVERYPASAWERWVHGLNFREAWYYDPDEGRFWRGQLDRHDLRTQPPRNWFEKGLQDVFGTYVYASKRWRELTLWGPYRLEDLRIDIRRRQQASLGPLRFPRGLIARFVAPAADPDW